MITDVKAALKQYLEEERACYDSPYVFLRIVPPYSHISVQAITKIVRTAIMAAGIDPAGRKQGAHAFRSSLASSMVNDNIPYEAVRKALGHTDQMPSALMPAWMWSSSGTMPSQSWRRQVRLPLFWKGGGPCHDRISVCFQAGACRISGDQPGNYQR